MVDAADTTSHYDHPRRTTCEIQAGHSGSNAATLCGHLHGKVVLPIEGPSRPPARTRILVGITLGAAARLSDPRTIFFSFLLSVLAARDSTNGIYWASNPRCIYLDLERGETRASFDHLDLMSDSPLAPRP
jgi:hypothetical protein